MIRLDKLLSNRGYCSRRDVRELIRVGLILVDGERPRGADVRVEPGSVTFDGEPLDPGEGLVLLLHKPKGYSCSRKELGQVVFELLPERYSRRSPVLSTVGRLDKDTTGLLLLTDDGALLHRLTSPKHKVPKVYLVQLAEDLRGDEAELFASGTLMLEDEDTPLQPAQLRTLSPRSAELTIHEGRYHQVKRMFEATGNQVLELHRARFGNLDLGDLPEGEFRILEPTEVEAI